MSSIPQQLWAVEYRTYTGTALSPFFCDKELLTKWFDSSLNSVRKLINHVLLYTYNERDRSYNLFSTYPASLLDKYCPDNLNKDTPCEGVTNLILRINELEAELLELRQRIIGGSE